MRREIGGDWGLIGGWDLQGEMADRGLDVDCAAFANLGEMGGDRGFELGWALLLGASPTCVPWCRARVPLFVLGGFRTLLTFNPRGDCGGDRI